jgi:SAM-dependent methyltransferase
MLHSLAGHARRALGIAVLIVPVPANAGDPRTGSRSPASERDQPHVAYGTKHLKALGSPECDICQKPGDIVSLLQLWPGNVVANIGARTGHFEPYLAKAVGPTGRVLALDVEPHMATTLKRRVKAEGLENVTVQPVAVPDPGLAQGSVDRLLVANAWHRLPQRAQYAATLNRALRPGGFLVVVDFTAASPEGPPANTRLSPATVIADLQAGGFSARTVEESLPLQYVVIGQKPVASQGRPAPTARQRALVDVIKANADRARFTRGVNTYTVQALKNALQPDDDPELRALLFDDDPIVTRTAASVFSTRGDRGLAVLREVAVDAALPANNRSVVDDVLWTANARQAAVVGARRYVNPGPERRRAPHQPSGPASALDED